MAGFRKIFKSFRARDFSRCVTAIFSFLAKFSHVRKNRAKKSPIFGKNRNFVARSQAIFSTKKFFG